MTETFYLLNDATNENEEDLIKMEDFCIKIELDINDIIGLLKTKLTDIKRKML